VRQPTDGETLIVGEPFRVVADTDIDDPRYAVHFFEITLSDSASGFRATWQIPSPQYGEARVIDEILNVPGDAPPGGEYTLSVSILPGLFAQGGPGYSVGHSIRVIVSTSR
jgi:hypothetical protein